MRRHHPKTFLFAFLLMLMVIRFVPVAYAAPSANQIVKPVNESDLVQLTGNVYPLASSQFDEGLVAESFRMEHMFVVLRRSPEQEQALQGLETELQNPHSANYHKWLTAAELGKNFGPAQEDIQSVVRWLGSHGLQVNLVHASGMIIDVSGTAGQVNDAFHTEIHHYKVKGEEHIANATDPKIPAALAPVVVGVNSLNDFMPKSQMMKPKSAFSFPCTGCPGGFDNAEQFDVAPPDFATIYNVSPLYTATKPITGKGQTVVVLEDSDIQAADVTTFRKAFGLSSFSGTFTQIHPGTGCTDPGRNGDEGEAALDAEWSGAVAPNADVELASCADTATNFGGFIAAQNLLDTSSPPPIMSLSFGQCEADEGPGGNAFINSLWEQAAFEGVSVFVSAGDGGAAGCDNHDTATFATGGISANSFASTPFNFATGGTDFADTFDGKNSTFWTKSNSATGKSAKSYIPEMTWDDSCASNVLVTFEGFSSGVSFCDTMNFLDIAAGSGAPSIVYSKPFFQGGVFGVPADGKRDLPDASLFASNGFWSHALLFCMSDAREGGSPCNYSVAVDAFNNSAGGTSFTAPQFAGIQALIDQKAGGPQGNPAQIYYDLAASEYGSPSAPNTSTVASCNANNGTSVGKSCIFRDTTLGSIDVPCFGTNNCFLPNPSGIGVLSVTDSSLQEAYPTTKGWDFATGLGSPNVTNLVNNWP